MRDGGFDAAFLAVGAHLGKRAYIPAGSAAKVLDAVSVLRSMEGEERAAARPPGRRLRRGEHRHGRRPHGSSPRRGGGGGGLPPQPRPHARARLRGRGGARGGRARQVALDRSSSADEGRLVLERMELDDSGFPQPTGELEELEADSLVLALGQETDLSLLDGVAGIEVERRRRAGRRADDDRPPGRLRGRRHGACRAHRDGRRSATASRPPAASTRGCAAPSPGTTSARRSSTFDELNPWYYSRCAPHNAAAARGACGGARRSTRSSAGSTRRRRSSRPVAACRAATASPATTASASAPTTPSSSSTSPGRTATRSTWISARAAACAPQECPAGAIEMTPEQI